MKQETAKGRDLALALLTANLSVDDDRSTEVELALESAKDPALAMPVIGFLVSAARQSIIDLAERSGQEPSEVLQALALALNNDQ